MENETYHYDVFTSDGKEFEFDESVAKDTDPLEVLLKRAKNGWYWYKKGIRETRYIDINKITYFDVDTVVDLESREREKEKQDEKRAQELINLQNDLNR